MEMKYDKSLIKCGIIWILSLKKWAVKTAKGVLLQSEVQISVVFEIFWLSTLEF